MTAAINSGIRLIKRVFLQLLCLVFFMATPILSLGTGLGEVQVKSGLGEPLFAEIDLLGISQDEVNGLEVKLATSDEYLTLGLSDLPAIRDIHFDILQKGDNFRLILRTRKPVNEPFLDVLLHLDSATAHLYRQYTLLLDPPTSAKTEVADASRPSYNEAPEADTTANVKYRAKKTASSSSSVDESQDPEAAPKFKRKKHKKITEDTNPETSVQPVKDSGETYLTKEGDIFGKVAQRYQPDGMRLKDVMAAFYQANPDAFLNGDVNSLKAGQVLKVPDLQGLAQGKPKKNLPDEAKPTPPAPVEQPTAKADKPKFVLHLSAGDSSGQDMPLDPNKPVDAISSAQATPPQPEIQTNIVPNPEPVAPQPEVTPVPAPASAPAVVNVPAKPPVNIAIAPVKKSFFSYDSLMENLVWLSVGLSLVLALGIVIFLVVILKAKLKKKALDDLVETGILTRIDQSSNFEHSSASMSRLKGEDFMSDDFLANSAFPNNTNSSLDLHEVDPITESEVYSAYGRFDQAAMILESAIEKAPERHELKIALMKVYAERKYFAMFEGLFLDIQELALQNKDDNHYLATALEMGRKLDPENPLYKLEDISISKDDGDLNPDAEFFNVDDELANPDKSMEVTDMESTPVAEPASDALSADDFHKTSLSDDLKKLQESNIIEFEMIKTPEAGVPEEPEKTFQELSESTIVLDGPVIVEFETDTPTPEKKTGKK